jgi:hypothetical protein
LHLHGGGAGEGFGSQGCTKATVALQGSPFLIFIFDLGSLLLLQKKPKNQKSKNFPFTSATLIPESQTLSCLVLRI